MSTDEKYQETVDGIALARRTVEQTSRTIRDAMDNGDDPVIFLHNLAGSLGRESPFQTGGQGSAIYVVACFLLAESGFFEEGPGDKCTCPGPEHGEPTEYLATCPVHRGSWAETLEILADRELAAELASSIEDLGDIDANYVDAEDIRAAIVARHAAEDVAIAEALEAAAPYCSGYCSELPGIVAATHDPRCSEYKEPCCSGHHVQCTAVDICCCGCPEMTEPDEICQYQGCGHAECSGEHPEIPEPAEMERRYGVRVGQCTDPNCFQAGCDGDHDELRCPTTGVVRGNIATVDGRWVCCGGDYPDHAELMTCGDPYCGKPGCDGSVLHEPDRHVDGGA